MYKRNKIFLATVIAMASFIGVFINLISVFAWCGNYIDPKTGQNGRLSYMNEEINDGTIGAAPKYDEKGYKNNSDHPGEVVSDPFSDSESIDSREKNFVAGWECIQREDGSWESVTKETAWNNNDITVEDGKTYMICMYIHNNYPNSADVITEDIYVSFSIPANYDQENEYIQVNGFIDSSNAMLSEYWDYVNFKSDTPFRLEYIYGSALLENEGITHGGLPLSDDIVKAKSGGTLIGYDVLGGKIPGGLQYDNYVSIKVRAVFEDKYSIDQKVRLADSEDRTWKDSVDAKIGDKVEFRIGYDNTSDKTQTGVAIKDILPANLKYVAGSSVIKNSNHPNGARIIQDSLVANGIAIGNYGPGANAFIYFAAEVVDDNLEQGLNILTNWAQVGVGDVTIQDSVDVRVQNDRKYYMILTVYGVIIVVCFLIIVFMIRRIIKRNNLKRIRRRR